MKRSLQKGFTLIELMIVVAIIGILAAVALPAYQDYTARAQTSEAFTMVDGLKTKIEEAVGTGSCPANATAAVGDIAKAADIKGKYVVSVTLAGTAPACTAVVKMNTAANGVNSSIAGVDITFTRGEAGGMATWPCTVASDKVKYFKTCTAAS